MSPQDPSTVREIHAVSSDVCIRVYQAYSDEIADAALEAGTFVSPPFKMDRMTWIKPSFLWMMYRSGWATKPGQRRILAVDITREGFEWALSHACLSSFEPGVYGSKDEWEAKRTASPVRIQWDPDRDIWLAALARRAIQVGLSREAIQEYVTKWIQGVEDVTGLAIRIHELLRCGQEDEARAMLPDERLYPIPESICSVIGC